MNQKTLGTGKMLKGKKDTVEGKQMGKNSCNRAGLVKQMQYKCGGKIHW